MSSTPQGEGWFEGADGRWYPPQGAAAPATPTTPKKKFYQRVWFWLLVVFALVIAGCSVVIGGAAKVIDTANKKVHQVEYSVTGDGSADVTYASLTGGGAGESQESGVLEPWTKHISAKGIFSAYSLLAQIKTGTSVTCTISVDGKVVSTNTASGEFAIATCSGSAISTP